MSLTGDPNVRTIQIKPGTDSQPSVEMGGELPIAPATGGSRKRASGGSARPRGKTHKVLQVGEVTKLEGVNAKNSEYPTKSSAVAVGGGSTSPGTALQLAASHVPGTPGAPSPVGVDSVTTQKGAPVAATGGGPAAAKVKVVLAAAKKKKPGVVLAAKGSKAAPVVLAATATAPAHRKTLKRHTRKIKVSMKTLHKKINRAKTIRRSAEGASLEQIKKELQKAGILKADSKAPEAILRQMYADFMTLKSRAL